MSVATAGWSGSFAVGASVVFPLRAVLHQSDLDQLIVL